MFRRFLQSLAPLVRPPFNGLWLIIVLYFGWCFLVYPNSQILRGNLPDPDDYMYLTQVLDWLQGQGWYDNIQHRLNPPADGSVGGVPIHFSRIAQMPMAALINLLKLFGLGGQSAAMLMALIYPLILFTGFMFALRWLAESFVPKKWAGVSAYITLFTTTMIFMFMPGHVDHHGLGIIIICLVLGCVMRMDEEPGNPVWGLMAGFLLALGLGIALEILPWLLIVSLWIGLWATAKGGAATRNAFGFGLALHLGSIVILAITRPPDQWLVLDVLSYSAVYVLLTGAMAVVFAGLALMGHSPARLRWPVVAFLASILGYGFLYAFPDMVMGPYGGMNPELAQIMLGEIDEAMPLVKSDNSWRGYLVRLGGFTMALATAIYFFQLAKTALRWRWGLVIALLLAAAGLTLFYQYRFIAMMGMFTILPLTVLLQRGWVRIQKLEPGRRKFFAKIGLILLVGPLPAVLLPTLIGARDLGPGIFLFPVDAGIQRTPCDTYVLEKVLRDPKLYGDKSHLVMTSMGLGPEILFRTPHKVLSAPYHMNVSGNTDATRFFSTPYVTEAEAIARRRGADLVAVCRYVPHIYTRPPATVGDEHAADFAPHMAERLVTGKAPQWLKRVKIPALKNFVLFEVVPNGAASGGVPRSR